VDLATHWIQKMLKALRWKLALLYFSSTVGIVVLLATGTYLMLHRFFIQQIDLALQYKMAGQFKLYGLSLPAELENAEKNWLEENPHPTQNNDQITLYPVVTPTPQSISNTDRQPVIITNSDDSEPGNDDGEENHSVIDEDEHQTEDEKEAYIEDDDFDGRLASIFIVPIATLQSAPVSAQKVTSPIDEDIEASDSALSLGYDLRTVHLPDGTRARLLTYRIIGQNVPSVFQIGRLLDDQDRLLRQYLIGLLTLGVGVSLLTTVISWLLSGRSIKPAVKAWNQQQNFITNASHELRTPLTLIRANADYAIKSKKSGVQARTLKEVVGEVDYMNRMVDDLILLSRLDARKLRLDHKAINLEDLLLDISYQAGLIAKDKTVRIANSGAGCQIGGDPDRIRQVLLILIDNALRFTPPGGVIELGALCNKDTVDIYVSDNGLGILPEHQSFLFDRFYQVPGQITDGVKNNGLGLSIAKGLIENQAGKIRIESQPGHGTKVWITMPSK
jgi:signal transduction histidine kinase